MKGRVSKLEGSIDEVRETLKAIKGRTRKLDLRKDQFKEQVLGSIGTNLEEIQWALKSIDDKLTKRNNTLEAIVMALKKDTKPMMMRIKELEGELTMCRAAVGKGMLVSIPKQCKMNVPKLKEFKGMRSTKDMDNLL